MKFIPAIDLKDNRCVRLRRGKEEDSTIFNENPVEQAIFFEKNGCERIHIVDLDGAFGRKDINKETIKEIRKKTSLQIELGGGISKEEDIIFWINTGINFLIIGSLATTNTDLIINLAKKYKNKIYVALDVLENEIMIRGWVEKSNIKIEEMFNTYNNSFIKGYILTDISRDGMLNGINISLIKNIMLKTKKDFIVGGGLSNYEDLENLKKTNQPNLEGIIAGKSFYSGSIKIDKALKMLKKDA